MSIACPPLCGVLSMNSFRIQGEMQEIQSELNRHNQAYLDRLLSERNQNPERTAEIDVQIRQAFERKVAILALDMCGFSALTDRYGIIHYLAMIHQMGQASAPAIAGNGGQIVKHEADNLYAVFTQPADALEAALDIFRAFEAMNAVLPNERDIYGSIGIGFGDTLVIEDCDLFGAEMNLASKLGEDLATRMQILLTPAAYAALPPDRYVCSPVSFPHNDAEFNGYCFELCLYHG